MMPKFYHETLRTPKQRSYLLRECRVFEFLGKFVGVLDSLVDLLRVLLHGRLHEHIEYSRCASEEHKPDDECKLNLEIERLTHYDEHIHDIFETKLFQKIEHHVDRPKGKPVLVILAAFGDDCFEADKTQVRYKAMRSSGYAGKSLLKGSTPPLAPRRKAYLSYGA
jgi:hypothetical protein